MKEHTLSLSFTACGYWAPVYTVHIYLTDSAPQQPVNAFQASAKLYPLEAMLNHMPPCGAISVLQAILESLTGQTNTFKHVSSIGSIIH